jgi:hypothetical protein
MLQQKQVVVNDCEYMITQFPATKGVRLAKQVGKLVAPVMRELYSEDGGYLRAVEAFLLSLDDVDFETLSKDLIGSVSKQGMSINFDYEFAGKYDVLLRLLLEVIQFNFGSVFTLLGSEE